jgi:anti-sigma regulatory factor (Ser/Thr protein kinase)
MRAVEAFQEFARPLRLPETVVFGLALAIEECGSNIVNHALKGNAKETFRVVFQMEGDTMHLELRDPGPPFDPTAAAPRKPQAEDDDLPGGWGIHLVRRYTDEMTYVREGNENVLRLTKRITAAGAPAPS